jgi:hypothetical protein
MASEAEYRKKFNLAHNLVGTDINVMVGPARPNQVILRCEKVSHASGTGKRTGKYIHLGMTAADAMRLLAMLSAVQKKFGYQLPPGEETFSDFVPPDSKKH